MKHLSFFLLVLLCYKGNAQKIHFSDSTNVWKNSPNMSPAYTWYGTGAGYAYAGDTIINSIQYRKMYGTDNALIREDTLTGKVYARIIRIGVMSTVTTCTDTSEHLLYDYNWQIGDTFKVVNCYTTVEQKIVSIDSTQINNTWYKIFSLQNLGSGWSYKVLEGIGCLYDPVFPLFPMTAIEGARQLLCFSNKGSHPIINPPVGIFDNSYSCTLSIANIESVALKATVVPNPANKNSKFVFSHKLTGTLITYDVMGRIFSKQSLKDLSEIPLSDPGISGVYFYKIIDKTGQNLFVGKFNYE